MRYIHPCHELPLRHIFTSCDGGHGTSGPESFAGPLGTEAKKELHLQDVVPFIPIESSLSPFPEKVWKDLSKDQQMLYRYIEAIKTGVVPANLRSKKCGPMNHSRWLTFAIRLQQLYTRTPNPCDGLKTVVTYIVQVYGPMWFLIKSSTSFTDGPLLLFTWMKLIQNQPQRVQLIAKPVVQRNGWQAETGFLLSAMLSSQDSGVRQKAVKIISQLRLKPKKKPRMRLLQGIRKLQVPELQWSASSWPDIIQWEKATISEPYILKRLTLEELRGAIKSPVVFPSFPLHSQSVERAVKLVSEAGSQVIGS